MRYSIIIPVYNVADYLASAVESVLKNDTSDTEIILVDDGSDDGVSPALCDALAEAHPTQVRVIHQKNLGLGGARNTGIDAARGEYLIFLDSDDTIEPNTISSIDAVIETHHPDVVSFGMYSDDGNGKLTPVVTNAFSSDKPFTLAEHPEFLLSLPSACCRAWRRQMLIDSGIRFPAKVWYEDIRTTSKLFALADSIVTLDAPLYRYLQRPGSIMNSASLSRNLLIIDAFADIVSWYREAGLFDSYRREIERLAIDHILLAATVRVARSDPKNEALEKLYGYMLDTFPHYRRNPYFGELSTLHRLLIRLIEKKRYAKVRNLFKLKEILSR